MAKTKRFLLTTILIFVMTSFLFPYISSRVKGVVRDKETREVIKDAEISLYYYNDKPFMPDLSKYVKTDKDGCFVIDDVLKGTYIIECYKEGYATFSPEYFSQTHNPTKYLSTFFIEEGQIKHFEILMERGGKLKVTVNKKDENGMSSYKGIEIGLYAVVEREQSDEKDYCTVFNREVTNEQGQVLVDGLIPGLTYGVRIEQEEFPNFEEEVIIEKDQTVEISFLYDYTDKTGIAGSITFSDKPLLSAGIYVVKSDNKCWADLDILQKNKYCFRTLAPGNYMMYIFVTYLNEKSTIREIPIVVEKNKTNIKDLNL